MRTTAMGSLRTATVAALLAGIALSACASEPAPEDETDTSRTYLITYSAVATGDGVWNQIQYDNGLGSMITVNNPLRSWTTQVQMKEGDNVFIVAQGAVGQGTLSIAATGDDGGDNTVGNGDSKAGDGTTTVYDLATTPITLP
jgi:hypothetical protein